MFVTQTHTVWGGMELWLDRFAQWMLDRGWDVVAGLARGARYSDPDAYAAAHPHLRPVVMDATVGTESARVAAVTRAIRHTRPDVVIPIGIGSIFPAIPRRKPPCAAKSIRCGKTSTGPGIPAAVTRG